MDPQYLLLSSDNCPIYIDTSRIYCQYYLQHAYASFKSLKNINTINHIMEWLVNANPAHIFDGSLHNLRLVMDRKFLGDLEFGEVRTEGYFILDVR